MAPSKKDLVKLKFRLEHIIADRTQYKPYISQLMGDGKIFVEIEVDKSGVADAREDEIVLNLTGLSAVLIQVADAITDADAKSRITRYGS